MAQLKLEQLTKVYAGDAAACDIVQLEVAHGELLVLVGPSGSGKSTILRLIAGLEEPASGSVYIAGRRVNNLPARHRNVAMVFQSQAIYPHWSVYKNLAFGLELRESGWRQRFTQRLPAPLRSFLGSIRKPRSCPEDGLPRPSSRDRVVTGRPGKAILQVLLDRFLRRHPNATEVADTHRMAHNRDLRRRVREVAALLEIEGLLKRRGSELSGGEEQRVALGRAILRRPVLFLFDEPLSSLDAQLRVELRRQLKRLHTKLGATMIYVTHDQSEALALADRIAVLNEGRIEQIGTPQEVYECPANRFVASFMSASPMAFFEAYPAPVASAAPEDAWRLMADGWCIDVAAGWWRCKETTEPAIVGLRPDDIWLRQPGDTPLDGGFPHALATIAVVEYQAEGCLVSVVPGNMSESGKQASPESAGAVLLGRALVRSGLKPGEQLIAWFDMRRAHWFDGKSGRNLCPTSAD